MLSIGVLGSGKGSNLQAILDAIESGQLEARVACVLSDVEDAYILERARKAGSPAIHIDCAPYKTKLDGEAEAHTVKVLQDHGVDLVVLAGFMRMIKAGMLEAFQGRMINIHPSLLPAFPGLASWKQALEYGVRVAGCTVHFVDAGMDTGPILVQKSVEVLDDDTPGSLHARIQEQEHLAYVEAIQLISCDKAHIDGRRVRLHPPAQ